MEQKVQESTLQKIKKLMAMAEGGTLHEQEIATKKIQELLLKHNLELEDVTSTVDEHANEVGHERVALSELWKKNEGKWIWQLYGVLARNNLCNILTSGSSSARAGQGVVVVGTKANVEIVKFLASSLLNRIRLLEAQSWADYKGYDKRGTYRRGFFLGAVHGINEQLVAQKKVYVADDPNMNALVIRHEQDVEDYTQNTFNPGKGRRTSSTSVGGLRAGHAAGKSMGIHQGISGMSNVGGNYGGMLKGRK